MAPRPSFDAFVSEYDAVGKVERPKLCSRMVYVDVGIGIGTEHLYRQHLNTSNGGMDGTTGSRLSLPRTWSGRRCPRRIRELLPMLDGVQDPAALPDLPSLPRTFSESSFLLTTHLVPAALPRSSPDAALPDAPLPSADKDKRDATAIEAANLVISMRQRQWNGELPESNSIKPPWVCLNRYVRREIIGNDARKGVTLLLLPANGFPKESWEPMISHLVEAQRQSDFQPLVDEVWAWEAVNHGDAFLVNKQDLGSIFDCRDNARDILQFMLHYMPEHSSTSVLPTHLARLPDATARQRRLHGLRKRMVVGVGHSLGGCSIARAAIDVPALFSSLILVEPAIVPHPCSGPVVDERAFPYIVNALKRESIWPSRENARNVIRASTFFQTWDPEVFDNYVEYALYEDRDGAIKLKTPPVQEALGFSDVLTMCETWDLLDELDERVELRFIVPGKQRQRSVHQWSKSRTLVHVLNVICREDGIREMTVWRRPMNSSNIIFPSAGHLIVQETPRELGQEIQSFLQRKYGSSGSRL
ncbi:Alpha/beta hydrolase family-domain-containing protein [Rhodofomes roseus]|uniref:Alpha/beta hydrolase family-domain-containing protein n=1 Tax=Rhodofomes roseus TaxID=34475 RepID=A0ABQ8KVK9_9APHY|nr:Alpha/beta hydrolase family-domain-containing protein [Rhodofomes roseus]KAH9842574.1 Alpha/beta hydrolase family-domain-containing protein [Rhodofomes roseus]